MSKLNLSPQLLAYVDAQVRAHGLSSHDEYVRALLRREPDRPQRMQALVERTAAALARRQGRGFAVRLSPAVADAPAPAFSIAACLLAEPGGHGGRAAIARPDAPAGPDATPPLPAASPAWRATTD